MLAAWARALKTQRGVGLQSCGCDLVVRREDGGRDVAWGCRAAGLRRRSCSEAAAVLFHCSILSLRGSPNVACGDAT